MRPLVAAVILLSTLAPHVSARVRVTRPPATWGMPACDPFRVGGAFWYTVDNAAAGLQYIPLKSAPQDLAVSEVANLMFAIFEQSVFESPDAGCTWKLRANVGGAARVIATNGGRAYAWSDAALVRVLRDRVETASVPDRLLIIAASPENADQLFAVSFGGTAYGSANGGTTWERRAAIGRTPLRAAAVNPLDSDHAIAAGTAELSVTRDGGRTWTTSAAPDSANASSVAFSAAEKGVVWVAGAVPSMNRQALYRSTDGGATFTRIIRSSPLVPFTASARIAPHPFDASFVAFTTANGFAILDANANTTRVSVMATVPEAVVWSPDPRVIYVTTAQISAHVY